MDERQLLMEINPVFLTAKNTIRTRASLGYAEAQKLVDYMERDGVKEVFIKQEDSIITSGFASSAEARYNVMNQILMQYDGMTILDIPCGYTTRGIECGKKRIRYIGADLPAVIADIQDAVSHCLDQESLQYVSYARVDATNYHSLEQAVVGVEGPLCIATEGLLDYFTDDEMEAFFNNIHRLLVRHGGCWITPDREISEYMRILFPVLTQGNEEMMRQVANRMTLIRERAKSNIRSSTLYKRNIAEAIVWAEQRGFVVERIPFGEYLQEVRSIQWVRPGILEELKAACKNICVWKLTVNQQAPESVQNGEIQHDFGVKTEVEASKMTIHVSGRMDTLTAPDVMRHYESRHGENMTDVVLDFAELDYISSAGLRVLLMLLKKHGGKEHIAVVNYNKNIAEIFDTTGFSEILF